MWDHGDSPKSMTAIGPLAVVAAGVLLLFLLSDQALAILTVWTLASFPIGILIGNCVLKDERPRLGPWRNKSQ
jgi:energy-converting hydrogenase Eha subunit E